MTFDALLVALNKSLDPTAQRAVVVWDLLLERGFGEHEARCAVLAMLGELKFVRAAYPSHPRLVAHIARVVFCTAPRGNVVAVPKCGRWSDEIVRLYVAPQTVFTWGDDVPPRGTMVERCKSCWKTERNEVEGPVQ